MKNQDMQASAISGGCNNALCEIAGTKNAVEVQKMLIGETKYEKAFWQVYSAMIVDPDQFANYDKVADCAIQAVNAGFKALEKRDD